MFQWFIFALGISILLSAMLNYGPIATFWDGAARSSNHDDAWHPSHNHDVFRAWPHPQLILLREGEKESPTLPAL